MPDQHEKFSSQQRDFTLTAALTSLTVVMFRMMVLQIPDHKLRQEFCDGVFKMVEKSLKQVNAAHINAITPEQLELFRRHDLPDVEDCQVIADDSLQEVLKSLKNCVQDILTEEAK